MTVYEKLAALSKSWPRYSFIRHGETVGRVTGYTFERGVAYVDYTGGKGHYPLRAQHEELKTASEREAEAAGWRRAQ